MLTRKTPLKAKNISLKKTPLKAKTGLKKAKTTLRKSSPKAQEAWTEAREECLKRDGHKCQVCGGPATQVHHVHLRSQRVDLKYSLNNLISLCDVHHFHSGSERYHEQTKLIASHKNMTVEELLKYAES